MSTFSREPPIPKSRPTSLRVDGASSERALIRTVGMVAGPAQVHQGVIGCSKRLSRHDHRTARTNFTGRSAIEPLEPSALAKPAAISFASTAAGSIVAK